MSQRNQPRRRNRIFLGDYTPKQGSKPSDELKAKGDAYIVEHDGTEIIYGFDGRIEEIINHKGLPYRANSPEELLNIVANDATIRDLCQLDSPGAITTMRALPLFKEQGNLGTYAGAQQVDRNRLVHGGKFAINANENSDGTWTAWRIVDNTEKLPLDTTASLSLSKRLAIKKAEKAARKGLKLKDKRIRCELAEDEGGYQVQLNSPPGEDMLKPIQRIFLRFIDPLQPDISIPVEVIIDSHGKAVFGQDLNYYMHVKGFLMEPTAGNVQEAILQTRVFELPDTMFEKDEKTGKAKLANKKVEIYYDPKDQGNANTILQATNNGLIHELGSSEQAAVIAFYALNSCAERHALTGSPVPDKLTKAYIGLKEMFRQNITDNAAYFPSAGVIGFGLRVRNVVANGRHLLVIQHVIYHERGHKEDDQIQKAKGKRITGSFMAGVGEHDGDVDAFCFTILDMLDTMEKLPPGDKLRVELTPETFFGMKGELAKLAFGEPIRVMENEWTYPMDESTEEHDIGEKLDALTLHTLKAWVKGEYEKSITPEMSTAAKHLIFRKVLREVCLAMVTIRKIVISILKENRPNLLDLYRAYKLVARRNYGDTVESYFHYGYTVKHGVPDTATAEA
ncbi:MAG: hypothetical protein K2Y22_06555 [Candidatus Obscuribacterales bacterium]|nr:hypothetical protein [Candidatus Obscuribacterales bacterium]